MKKQLFLGLLVVGMFGAISTANGVTINRSHDVDVTRAMKKTVKEVLKRNDIIDEYDKYFFKNNWKNPQKFNMSRHLSDLKKSNPKTPWKPKWKETTDFFNRMKGAQHELKTRLSTEHGLTKAQMGTVVKKAIK